jgi:crotonobetainyl-CoA:carnitine CoA-transferase CaiB-like acyl-CoA transferase
VLSALRDDGEDGRVDYSGAAAGPFRELLAVLGVAADSSGSSVRLDGEPPVLNSPHRIGLAGDLALLAQGASTAALWERRGGAPQEVRLASRDSVFALNPIPWTRRNGYLAHDLRQARMAAAGYFRTRDGRMFFMTVAYPKLLNGALRVLGCPHDKEAVIAAVARRDGEELEQAFIEAGLTGAMVRTTEEWRGHPQGQLVAQQPLIAIEKIGDAPPVPLGPGTRPLDGVRVADVAHVFAGPMLSRSLAEQGADVLHLGPLNPHLIDPAGMTIVTGIGKRSAVLDFDADGSALLTALLREADVLVQSWRPGTLGKRGFGPEHAAAIAPGIIYVSVACFGFDGPWAARAGFDPVALAASGMTEDEALRDTYKFSPPGILTDTIAAYLGAGAVAATLMRRAQEGGSWHIKLSLARMAAWIQSLGLYREGTPADDLGPPLVARMESPFGQLEYLPPVLRYSGTPAYFDKPPVPIGSSRPVWLPKQAGDKR